MKMTTTFAVTTAATWLMASAPGVAVPTAAQSQKGNAGWALVDCDKEQLGALQRAIDLARSGDTIHVTGTCRENVVIPIGKDQITLDGDGVGTVNGPDAAVNTIQVRGPRGITIRELTITGGRVGIDVSRGSSALIEGNIIEFTARNGITLGSFSTANIANNMIRNNPVNGILVTGNAFGFIGFKTADDTVASPNIVRFNGTGINVTLSSSARIAGNVISDNGRNGIQIERASQANVSDNAIDANGQNGIFVTENSGVNLGTDSGTGLFDAPNRTTANNVLRGISCRVGAYANGRLGTLNGNAGTKDIGTSCVDSLNLLDNF